MAARASVRDAKAVVELLLVLQKVTTPSDSEVLAARAAVEVDAGDAEAVAWLLRGVRQVDASKAMAKLLARKPASHIDTARPGPISMLESALRNVGEIEAANALLARQPLGRDASGITSDLITRLNAVHAIGAASEVSELAIRAVDQCDISDTIAVVRLLRTLSRVEASSAINKLLALNPFSQADLTDHHVFTDLISVLRDVGAASGGK